MPCISAELRALRNEYSERAALPPPQAVSE